MTERDYNEPYYDERDYEDDGGLYFYEDEDEEGFEGVTNTEKEPEEPDCRIEKVTYRPLMRRKGVF